MFIYLTEVGNSGVSFTFPALPDSVSVKGSAKYQNYDIIGKGTITIPNGTEVTTVSWSGRFFGESRNGNSFLNNWLAPRSCQNILEQWRDKGTILRLLVTDTNINYDVSIQVLDCDNVGASGDIEYSISFALQKELKIFTTDELGISIPAAAVESRPEPKAGDTYTVVSGDNLWKIAQKKLGKGSRYTEIYEANKDMIEASAKKHGKASSENGHWIYPGDTYTLPAV